MDNCKRRKTVAMYTKNEATNRQIVALCKVREECRRANVGSTKKNDVGSRPALTKRCFRPAFDPAFAPGFGLGFTVAFTVGDGVIIMLCKGYTI